jgi:hypothetical protein
VLKRIFGPKNDEVLGAWKKLRNEELHNLRYLLGKIKNIRSRRMRLDEMI